MGHCLVVKLTKAKLTNLKAGINKYVIIVGDFNNALFSVMDTTTRQKVSKETEDLNIINTINLIHIQNTLPNTTEYKFFSNAHRTFSIDHMLSQKSGLNRF